ncbi:hypothetical protein H257_19136, partial [Aphanomyces astaci]
MAQPTHSGCAPEPNFAGSTCSTYGLPRPTIPDPAIFIASILQGAQLPPAPWLTSSANWSTHGIAQDHLGHQAWQLVRALTLRQLWNDWCAAYHNNILLLPENGVTVVE